MAEPLKLNRRYLERALYYGETFKPECGQRVLSDLEAEYGGECHVAGDLYATLRKAYQRDMLERIKGLVKLSQMNIEVAEEDEKEEENA